jgi:hypothetical protein
MCGAIYDERTGLSFTIAAGPRQCSHFRARVLWDSWRYFTVSDSRLPFSSPLTTRRVTVEVFDRFQYFLYCCGTQLWHGPRREHRFPVSPLVRVRNLLPSNGSTCYNVIRVRIVVLMPPYSGLWEWKKHFPPKRWNAFTRLNITITHKIKMAQSVRVLARIRKVLVSEPEWNTDYPYWHNS